MTPEKFACIYCKEEKGMDLIKKGSLTRSTMKGKCKRCHADYCRNHQMRKRAEIKPDNYMGCDSCDRLFSIYQGGGTQGFKHRLKRIECPFCKSEDIYGLAEHKAG